jgi:hypothetical protein
MTKYVLDLCIPLTFIYVKFELNVYNCCGDNERELTISINGPLKIQTWPKLSYDISMCQIWVECVQPLPRLWMETDDAGMTEGRNDEPG